MTDLKSLLPQMMEAAGKATPGPWYVDPKAAEESFFEDVNILRHSGLALAVAVHNGDIVPPTVEANAALIALASPSNILALCNAYIALEGERDALLASREPSPQPVAATSVQPSASLATDGGSDGVG